MRRPPASTLIASLALFFALGGTAIAAKHYLITSTKQIKPSVLKQLHGAQGPQGPAGPQGAAGPSNLSALTSITGPTVEVPKGEVGSAKAVCPAGSHAISGGGSGGIAGIAVSEMETNHQEWFIIIANSTSITVKIHAEVQCAGAGQAVAAQVRQPIRASAEEAIRQAASLAQH